MLIMSLQAKSPEIKAEINPINNILRGKSWFPEKLPSSTSIKLAPIMGSRTIRKENFATSSLLFPSSTPVEIVAPDLEMPGMTAKA